MKIGILQTGRSPDTLTDAYGDYDDFFKRFLAGRGFEFQTYAALDDEIPDAPTDADGWLIAWHQDQVVARPDGARVLASSDFCVNAVLAYGNTAFSVQPHTEFTSEFLVDLIEARGDV